jgi:serine/threonine protein kinase
MDLSVENVCGLLIRSRLLSVEEVKAMYQRWLTESRDSSVGDLGHFGQWLVGQRYVTEYQAALLLHGHADAFFLDDYKILDRLGRGRMAGVYRAAHKLGQVVAIKVLPPSKAREPRLLARFQREAALTLRVNHPNVVRAFQTGMAKGLHYIVMEYLEGETLDEVLQRRGRLPADEAVALLHQVLLGLQHLHEQGVVHRDLKPSNLMLVPAADAGAAVSTRGCSVKILDVGLAKALFEEGAPPGLGEPNLTGEGVLLGTPDYLAPEQARNAQQADIRSDIYSAGCVLYHMITGQPPFPDKNIINQMVRHASETAAPLREFNPDVPEALQQIVNWMMAKDPDQRYPTPARAAQALEVLLAAGSAPPAAPPDDPTLSTYLNWLHQHGNGASGLPGPTEAVPIIPTPPGGVASALPAPPPGAEMLPGETASGPRVRTRKRRHGATRETPRPRAKAGPAGQGGLAADKPAEPCDVELVALPRPERVGFRLERRDFLMFALGAGSVIAAGLVGFIIQRVVRWLRER